MGSRRAVLALTGLALALGGCGEDDDENGPEAVTDTTAETQLAVQQDAEAKANARNLAVLVEVCFVDNQDYSKCLEAAGGEDVGQATVEAPSANEYVVISPSESGNEFRFEKAANGGDERTCEEPGTGGCADDGTW